jgi:GTPase SAR1 family protein
MNTVEKPQDRAVMVTICGDSGLGKTSLAAAFPKPIFVRAEDGLQAIPAAQRPDAFPPLSRGTATASVAALWKQLVALLKEEHDYQTVVIDSVTALERMFIAAVLEGDGKAKSINQALGGYGAGWSSVASMHQRVRKAAGLLNERRGMHVVFIAHADTEMMKTPDIDDYMRWTLRLNPKHCIAPYVDDVDVVGFLRLEMFTHGEEGERKKAISSGDRELVAHATAANVSKNRFGITEPLPCPMGVNPIAPYVPALANADGQVPVQVPRDELDKLDMDALARELADDDANEEGSIK